MELIFAVDHNQLRTIEMLTEWRWRLRVNARKIGQRESPGAHELGPVFFRTAPPCSGGYHLEMGGMLLHDTVWINCEKGATTENQGADVKYIYGLRGVCWWLFVLSDFTWLPLLGGGRKSWYIIIIVVVWLGSDRPSGLFSSVPALLLSILTSLLTFFISFHSCCSHAQVFGENTRARVPHFL